MTAICPKSPSHKAFYATGTRDVVCLTCHESYREEKTTRAKFGNVKVENRHGKFDSKKEAERYHVLVSMQSRGSISELVKHPRYELKAWSPTGPVIIGHYKADAEYRRQDGRLVAEDTKSPATKKQTDYRLRKKIFEANYPHIQHVEH